MTLQMKQDTGGTVTLQAATSGTATATVPAIAGVVSVELKGADIASATTTDLSTATGDFVDVTGTTTITGLGTLAAGIERTVRFTGALTLTHNATSLILPGAANITTAANDRAIFRSLGSGNWLCVSYNKASGAAVVSSGGGLTNWSESAGTYSSKDWKRFYPVSGTNVNAIVSPLGTGSFQMQVADGTSTGGNQRGSRAVDFGMSRSAASQVASGSGAFLSGINCTASGSGSVAIGNTCAATYGSSIAIGSTITSSGSFSVAIGGNLTSSAYGSVALGNNNLANEKYAMACGYTSTTRGIRGASAFASGNIDGNSSIKGKPQREEFILYRKTTDGTANQALITNFHGTSTAGTTNQIVLPDTSTYTFRALVTAHRQDVLSGLTNRSSWTVQGVAYRDSGVGTTAVSSTITTISNTPGYTLTVDADTTNGALRFKVTGTAGHTVLWVAHVSTVEMVS